MTSGGARNRSGPPGDPTALSRERDGKDWQRLTDAEVDDAVPEWPLPDCDGRELELWAEVWRMPQSRLWRRNRQSYEVAIHVRTRVEAEVRGASSAIRTLMRQQADALLLTIPAMHAAHVMLVAAQTADAHEATVTDMAAAKQRMSKRLRGGDDA